MLIPQAQAHATHADDAQISKYLAMQFEKSPDNPFNKNLVAFNDKSRK
jgi:hypothetical protein